MITVIFYDVDIIYTLSFILQLFSKKLQYKNEFFPSKEISKKTGIEWRNLTNKEK